jgi:hypothetical protein
MAKQERPEKPVRKIYEKKLDTPINTPKTGRPLKPNEYYTPSTPRRPREK